MLGAGLQFGRSRGGEDRFYNPAKARRNHGGLEPEKNPVSKPVESPVVCNLERFLESVTPSRGMGGWRNQEERQPYFLLGDLWESFKEWSAYGAGVPLILNDTDSVVQYYVPYLSGIQLYMDPLKSSAKSRQLSEDSDADSFRDSSSDVSSDNDLPKSEISHRLDQLSLNYQHALQEGFSSDEGESTRPQGCLSFEYMEHNQPWGREPLTDKILDLARCFPELKSIKSCDLLPSSWLSVAWYPIYRIPMGPTLKDLDACFLTYHSLHTPITENSARRHDGEFGNGEERRAPNGVVKRNGSPLTAPRRTAKPPSSSTPNALNEMIWFGYNIKLTRVYHQKGKISLATFSVPAVDTGLMVAFSGTSLWEYREYQSLLPPPPVDDAGNVMVSDEGNVFVSSLLESVCFEDGV
ncbi:hypothetical protein CTI12_AA421480 [Artemisia annua]|uniref:DUF789 domain-containing protein n=1 Tax=Artemisia annua TaxID=35608 RepID=A0A2U1M4Y7_ARTAN|nr:hypothetical protein CTI12_AA421480 [Artemisia annua]